jgi:hypothetical protein
MRGRHQTVFQRQVFELEGLEQGIVAGHGFHKAVRQARNGSSSATDNKSLWILLDGLRLKMESAGICMLGCADEQG